jgi:hypothetical protein
LLRSDPNLVALRDRCEVLLDLLERELAEPAGVGDGHLDLLRLKVRRQDVLQRRDREPDRVRGVQRARGAPPDAHIVVIERRGTARVRGSCGHRMATGGQHQR